MITASLDPPVSALGSWPLLLCSIWIGSCLAGAAPSVSLTSARSFEALRHRVEPLVGPGGPRVVVKECAGQEKGQQRGNREAKKPKKDKPKTVLI